MGTTYDRKAAMAYARAHWDRPCKDGKVYTFHNPIDTNGMKPPGPGYALRFVPDGTGGENLVWTDGATQILVHDWNGLADCAHFISECLNAGGAPVRTNWVPNFPGLLKAQGVKALAEKVSEARAADIIATGIMQPGDMICYFDFVGKEIKNTYMHSAMFTASDAITCHTKSRFGLPWNLHPDFYQYSLYHFPVDDNARVLLKPLAPSLVGWWQVTWRGKAYYYYFKENGSVAYTTKKPTSLKTGIAVPSGKGYWFGNPGTDTFFICWTSSGSIERFKLSPSTSIAGTWNEAVEKEPISGTKM